MRGNRVAEGRNDEGAAGVTLKGFSYLLAAEDLHLLWYGDIKGEHEQVKWM